jgi:hypothetical protein
MLVLTHHDAWPGSLLGCDLLLSLFFTALSSYRRATICQPFPSFFSSGASHTKIKEFDQLVRTTSQLLPPLVPPSRSGRGGQVNILQTLPPLSTLARDEGTHTLPLSGMA